ncbi:MAG TPA: flagellar motor protein MotB [Myxococcota bacterium]|jgi:chemotaxis protein MotB
MAKHDDHEEEHENHERWLVSYADFITLLFAFFVVMYAISSVDQKRVVAVERSVRWALHIAGEGGSGDNPVFNDPNSHGSMEVSVAPPAASADANKGLQNKRGAISKQLQRKLAQRDSGKVLVLVLDGKLVVRVAATHLFGEGGVVLEPAGLATLDAVATELAALDKPVSVEGHSDGTPSSRTGFDENWLVSARRAAAVVAYLDGAHVIPSAHLSMSAYGDKKPIAENDTPAGRAQNRRIEFVVDMR